MTIIVPGSEPEQENQEQGEELKYQATEGDEEDFFLMYNLKFQPTEVASLHPDYKKWLIARFIAQKQMEHEMIERQRMMQSIGPSLHV
jgi:hypothetical protein